MIIGNTIPPPPPQPVLYIKNDFESLHNVHFTFNDIAPFLLIFDNYLIPY